MWLESSKACYLGTTTFLSTFSTLIRAGLWWTKSLPPTYHPIRKSTNWVYSNLWGEIRLTVWVWGIMPPLWSVIHCWSVLKLNSITKVCLDLLFWHFVLIGFLVLLAAIATKQRATLKTLKKTKLFFNLPLFNKMILANYFKRVHYKLGEVLVQ